MKLKKTLLVGLVTISLVMPAAAFMHIDGFFWDAQNSFQLFETGAIDTKIGWNETLNGDLIEVSTPSDDPKPIFDLENLEPGSDGSALVTVDSRNNPYWLKFKFDQKPADNVSLEDNLNFLIWNDDGDGEYETSEELIANGTAREIDQELGDYSFIGSKEGSTAAFEPGEEFIGIKWSINDTCEIAGEEKEFDIGFKSIQERNNPEKLEKGFQDVEESNSNSFSIRDNIPCSQEIEIGVCEDFQFFSYETDQRVYLEKESADGTQNVIYRTEIRNSSIKFEQEGENALGEDGQKEHQYFEINTTSAEKISFRLKAGSSSPEIHTLGEEQREVMNDSFKVELVEKTHNNGTDTYRVKVTSDEQGGKDSPALSFMEFNFCGEFPEFRGGNNPGEPLQQETEYNDTNITTSGEKPRKQKENRTEGEKSTKHEIKTNKTGKTHQENRTEHENTTAEAQENSTKNTDRENKNTTKQEEMEPGEDEKEKNQTGNTQQDRNKDQNSTGEAREQQKDHNTTRERKEEEKDHLNNTGMLKNQTGENRSKEDQKDQNDTLETLQTDQEENSTGKKQTLKNKTNRTAEKENKTHGEKDNNQETENKTSGEEQDEQETQEDTEQGNTSVESENGNHNTTVRKEEKDQEVEEQEENNTDTGESKDGQETLEKDNSTSEKSGGENINKLEQKNAGTNISGKDKGRSRGNSRGKDPFPK